MDGDSVRAGSGAVTAADRATWPLTFADAGAERRYRAEHDERAARSGRLAISAGAPGYLLMLLILDDGDARAVAAAMVGVLTVWIALAWTSWYRRIYLATTVVAITVLGVLSTLLFRRLPAPSAVVVAIAFITLNFMWIFVFLRPRFQWALGLGAGYLAVVVVGGAGVWDAYGRGAAPEGMVSALGGTGGGAVLLLLYAGFLLVLTASIGHRLEQAERIDFLRREELAEAHQRSEQLLANILPGPIADRLKDGESPIADELPEVSVVFADIVGFTEMAAAMAPAEVLDLLDTIFSGFDRLAELHGLEKIKTIGDAYMAVAGAPDPTADHAGAAAEMALDMVRVAATARRPDGSRVDVRVGIDSGPAVAGVIGTHKFIYDLWGDTVNTASRMESHGLVGRVQVTESTGRLLHGRYVLEERGTTDIKGKGPVRTWLLLGRHPSRPPVAGGPGPSG